MSLYLYIADNNLRNMIANWQVISLTYNAGGILNG